MEQGKASQALAYLDKALEFDPEHEQALLNSAILLQELGRAELRKVARERLLKLLRKVNTMINVVTERPINIDSSTGFKQRESTF